MDLNLKEMRAEFQKIGIFYTPPEVAETVKTLIGIDHPREVYDPTVGAGALLAVYDDSVPKFGQELRPEALEVAQRTLENFSGYCGDTLAAECPEWVDKRFHVIIANPPFSVAWTPMPNDPRFSCAPALAPKSKADYAFILHCLHHLADDGIAFVIEFPGILYRGQSEGKIRRWLVEQNYVDQVVSFPSGLFTDTGISVCALVLRKDRAKDAPVTIIDYESDYRREVSRDEIAAQNYNLSPSTYGVPPVPEPEHVDIAELDRTCREGLLKTMQAWLRCDALSTLVRMSNPDPTDTETTADLQDRLDSIEQFLELLMQFDYHTHPYTLEFRAGHYPALESEVRIVGGVLGVGD